MKGDAHLSMKAGLNNWLAGHLDYGSTYQLDAEHKDEVRLQLARAAYRVSVTGLEDVAAIKAMEKCRGTMVEAHQAFYEPYYPGIRSNEWLEVLGQDTIRKSLELGIVMLHAESVETNEVVGYISCTEGADDEQFIGTWTCSSEPSHTHQIAKDKDGQLRVEGIFASGSGSGALAPRGKWLEAKILSSSDGRRVGIVSFCIAGPGRMAVQFKSTGETDWRRETVSVRVPGSGPSQDEGPHMKINHVVVLPGHHGRGVGRLLFEDLLSHLGKASPATSDLRLSVVERNLKATAWYLKLGFSIVDAKPTHLSTLKLGHVPVVFLEMQRRRGSTATPKERCFGREVCGEKVIILPDNAPLAFVAVVYLRVTKQPSVAIRWFDQASGLHRLEDGRTLDVTAAFSCGMLCFERPLHMILARSGGG